MRHAASAYPRVLSLVLVNQQLVWTTGRFLVAARREQTNRWRNKQMGRSGRKHSVSKNQKKPKKTKKTNQGADGFETTLSANETGRNS